MNENDKVFEIMEVIHSSIDIFLDELVNKLKRYNSDLDEKNTKKLIMNQVSFRLNDLFGEDKKA